MQVLLFGEAADPEVDLIETCDGAGRVGGRVRVKKRIARPVGDRTAGIRIDLDAVNGARIEHVVRIERDVRPGTRTVHEVPGVAHGHYDASAQRDAGSRIAVVGVVL